MASAPIDSLVAIAPDDVWAIVHPHYTRTLVQHFDGVAWSTSFEHTTPNEAPMALGASASDDVWLVGSVSPPYAERGGYLNHYDGQTWRRAPDAPSALANVRPSPGLFFFSVGI